MQISTFEQATAITSKTVWKTQPKVLQVMLKNVQRNWWLFK
jgi:hypothetical protein